MATSAEIKSNNNTLIRIKTTAKSITKENVADQLDASIDYTVQEISTVNSSKENLSNKSLNVTTDGASDVKYPSVKAVKTYVDANIPAAELLTNKSLNVTTDGASDVKYPSVKAVKTYVDANAGVVLKTKGTISGGTSSPYPQSTFDITLANTVAINSRVNLKNPTPSIGTVYRVINVGAFTIYVRASDATTQVFAINGLKTDKTEEVPIEVNGEYDFTYIDTATWLVNAVNDAKLQPLEYTCQLFQSGTSNITPQTRMIDTITKNYDGGSRFVSIVFSRLGVGDYYVRVRYSAISLDPTKLAVFFGDSTCRIYASSTGNDGANYKQWNFKTYTEVGVVSDDILQGNNGAFINIKLYR
jgi:hypothetical protein